MTQNCAFFTGTQTSSAVGSDWEVPVDKNRSGNRVLGEIIKSQKQRRTLELSNTIHLPLCTCSPNRKKVPTYPCKIVASVYASVSLVNLSPDCLSSESPILLHSSSPCVSESTVLLPSQASTLHHMRHTAQGVQEGAPLKA